MKQIEQSTLIISFTAICWLGMQAVHEFGHILAARATGGTVARVVLYPTTISRTEVFPNPHPLIEVWAGPVVGSILPLLAYLIAFTLHSPGLYLFRFFAGFCLVANGSYLFAGELEQMGDPGELVRHGAPHWQIIAVGLIGVAGGLFLWNGLGPQFGLGAAKGNVSRAATIVSLALSIAILAVEFAVGAS
jgi:hypothetical protein